MDPDRQRKLYLLARAKAQAALALEQEDAVGDAMNRSGTITFDPPPYQPEEPLGADYSKGYLDAAKRAVGQAWDATKGIARDTYNFIQPFDAYAIGDKPSGPYDTIARTAPEQTARVTGTLAAGVAGAAPGVALGASGGAFVGTAFPPIIPLTTAAGGIIGGAIGGGLGMLGFDVGTDVALDGAKLAEGAINSALSRSGQNTGFDAEQGAISNLSQQGSSIRPASEYGKDFVYNAAQGVVTGLAGGAVAAPIFGAKGLASYPRRYAERRVLETLNEDAPNWYNDVNEAFPQQQVDGGLPVLDPTAPERVPGLPDLRSLSELTDSPNLRIKERGFVHANPSLYGDKVERKKKRDSAHLRAMQEALGDSEATVGDTQSWIRSAVAEDLAKPQAAFEAELAARQQAFEAERAARQAAYDTGIGAVKEKVGMIPPEGDSIQLGVDARNVIDEGFTTKHGEVSAEFGKIENAPISRGPILAAIAEQVPKYFRKVGVQPSGLLQELIAQVTGEEVPVAGQVQAGPKGPRAPRKPGEAPPVAPTFTIKDAQKALNTIGKIIRGPDRESAGVARELGKAVDQALAEAEASGALPPEQLDTLRKARALRAEQGDIFEGKNNPNRAILEKEYSGAPVLQDSAVPTKIFTQGRVGAREKVLQYKKAIAAAKANYTTAMEPIYRYAAGSFRRFAVKADLTIDTKKANIWLKQHEEALKEIPELRDQLDDPVTAQAFMDEQFGALEDFQKTGTKELAEFQKTGSQQLTRTKADVENGALQFWLKTDVEPKVAVKQMLAGDYAGMNVKQTVAYLQRKGAKDAIAGLGRGVMEHLQEMAYEAPGKPNALAEARLPDAPAFEGNVRDALLISEWKKIRKAVDGTGLYTDSQMKTFDAIFEDKNSQMSIDKARLTPGSDTNQNSVVTSLLKVARGAMLKGKWPVMQFAASVLGRAIAQLPEGAFQKLLVEVTLDPRNARDLQNKATAKNLSRSAMAILGDRWHAATGDIARGQVAGVPIPAPIVAAAKGAKTVAPYAPAALTQSQREVPKQQAVTSSKSFPTPEDLLAPPAPGKLKKATPAMEAYSAADPTKKKVNFLGQPMANEIDDATLDAVRWVESKDGKYLTSPVGAQGPYQFMPAIAKAYGVNPTDDNHTDDRAGAKALLEDEFKALKDIKLALAAYNTGRPNVLRAIKRAGSREFDQVAKYLSKETREYVPAVLAAKQKVEKV